MTGWGSRPGTKFASKLGSGCERPGPGFGCDRGASRGYSPISDCSADNYRLGFGHLLEVGGPAIPFYGPKSPSEGVAQPWAQDFARV